MLYYHVFARYTCTTQFPTLEGGMEGDKYAADEQGARRSGKFRNQYRGIHVRTAGERSHVRLRLQKRLPASRTIPIVRRTRRLCDACGHRWPRIRESSVGMDRAAAGRAVPAGFRPAGCQLAAVLPVRPPDVRRLLCAGMGAARILTREITVPYLPASCRQVWEGFNRWQRSPSFCFSGIVIRV